jgi:ubiquinone biosynthesis protein UbiJ
MTTRDLALAGLEELLNRYIALDPDSKVRTADFANRIIAIELADWGLSWYLSADLAGRLQLFAECEREPDCVIHGNLLDLLRSGDEQRSAGQLFSGKVSVIGDTELAERFGALLSGLEIDWEEQLSHLTGDVVAHQAGRVVRSVRAYLNNAAVTAQRDVNEYLTQEARLLPARIEVRNWCDDVDTLRDDVERLAARIAKLDTDGKVDEATE